MLQTLIVLIIIVIPSSALAWGGGTHLELGITVLNNLKLLPATVATIIGNSPNDFLYGCLAADITVGKKFTHYFLNCHRWNVGFNVLKRASTPSQQSCAYGYLAHLAADIIAHNYYIPLRTMECFSTMTLKHAYWEVRFDSFVGRETWDLGIKVAKEHFEDNDELLRSVIASTLFSFGTNKKIFNSIMLLTRLEKWQQAIRALNLNSRFCLEESHRDFNLKLSSEAVFDILGNLENSRFMEADPTGERALEAGDAIRKNMRLLYRSGKISKTDAFSQLDELGATLQKSICEPDRLLGILSTG